MALKIKLEAFEGPLDLLLHLIEKNKVDIYDIPIASITEQYLEAISDLRESDLDQASDFLLMASVLLDIKARMLLPPEADENDEEIDPRAELMEQLIQYRLYKHMSYVLRDMQVDSRRQLYRSKNLPEEVRQYEQPVDLDALTDGLDLTKLKEIFDAVMKRREDRTNESHVQFGRIEREQISIEEAMDKLTHHIKKQKKCVFRDLLERGSDRMEIVVNFLAMLELMKTGTIRVVQKNLFDDICIEYVGAAETA